jgi:hypothetical protein
MSAYKLKLKSKKLMSGNYQIDFTAQAFSQELYGYLLAEKNVSVTEVVKKIGRHIDAMQNAERYYQRNLFSLTNREHNSGKILIFKRA